jgi:hypothetical protein
MIQPGRGKPAYGTSCHANAFQDWIHRNALAPLQEFYFYFINQLLFKDFMEYKMLNL